MILKYNMVKIFFLATVSFDQSYYDKINWFPTMKARALPGCLTIDSYESIVDEIIQLTKQSLPIDGLFFDIHGAMNVEGMDDPEGNLIQRLRESLGQKLLFQLRWIFMEMYLKNLLKNPI